MGLMDKVKDTVKTADEKLGNAIDKEKLDSKIRDEERKIEDCIKQIGQKVVAAIKDGKDANSADVADIIEKIKASEAEIEKLKAEKEAIGKKEE